MKKKLIGMFLCFCLTAQVLSGCTAEDAAGKEGSADSVDFVGSAGEEVSGEELTDDTSETEGPAEMMELVLTKKMASYGEDGNMAYIQENEYDEMGNLLREKFVDYMYGYSNETGYTYDEAGNRTAYIYYDENGAETRRTEYEYDAAGNVINATYLDGVGTVTGREISEYDAAGNCIMETSYDAAGNKRSWTEYAYSAAGSLVKSTNYSGDGSVSGISEYDTDGNRVKWVSYREDGGISYEYESEYGSDGKLLRTSSVDYDADGEIRRSSESRYNSAGLLLRETDKGWDGIYHTQNDDGVEGEYVYYYDYTYEYEYDAAGNMTKSERIWSTRTEYSYVNGSTRVEPSGGTATTSYEYDERGNVIRETGLELYDEDGDGEVRDKYDYESQGTHSQAYASGEDRRIETDIRYVYEYDSEGRILSKKSYEGPEDSEYEYYNWEEYQFDSAGNMTRSASGTYYDGYTETYNWMEWTYDAAGNLTESVLGSDNVPFRRSVMKYDDRGNVIESLAMDGEGNVMERMEWEYIVLTVPASYYKDSAPLIQE